MRVQPRPEPTEYDEEGDPFEIRICGSCNQIIDENDPGIPAIDVDGEECIVCTRHLEELGVLILEDDL